MAFSCPVCKRDAEEDLSKPRQGDHYWIACERCGGTFEIGGSYYGTRRHASEPLPAVSGMLRHAFEEGQQPRIGNQFDAQRLGEAAPTSPDVIARQLLESLARRAERRAGHPVVLTHATDYPLAYAANEKELVAYLDHLASQGWIEVDHADSATTCTLTVTGLMQVEGA